MLKKIAPAQRLRDGPRDEDWGAGRLLDFKEGVPATAAAAIGLDSSPRVVAAARAGSVERYVHHRSGRGVRGVAGDGDPRLHEPEVPARGLVTRQGTGRQ